MVSSDWWLFCACSSLFLSNVCAHRSLFLFRVSFHAAYYTVLLHKKVSDFSVEPGEVTGGLPSHGGQTAAVTCRRSLKDIQLQSYIPLSGYETDFLQLLFHPPTLCLGASLIKFVVMREIGVHRV